MAEEAERSKQEGGGGDEFHGEYDGRSQYLSSPENRIWDNHFHSRMGDEESS